jgi:hypothetical protein
MKKIILIIAASIMMHSGIVLANETRIDAKTLSKSPLPWSLTAGTYNQIYLLNDTHQSKLVKIVVNKNSTVRISSFGMRGGELGNTCNNISLHGVGGIKHGTDVDSTLICEIQNQFISIDNIFSNDHENYFYPGSTGTFQAF